MGRILFFVLLGVALYVGFRIWRIGKRRDEAAAAKPGQTSEPMIRCAHCGLNVPRSEAVADAGRWYCSEAHRRLESGGR
jgi:uncharacterized protein